MAKKAYIGAPLKDVMTSNNVGSWFTLSDPDGISSWNGTTLTVTGISSNERVKLTALRDMTVSFDYTTDSFCKISFKGQYICDNGDDGHYTATLEAGKYFYFSNSSAVNSQTCKFTNITCTSATSVAHKIKKGYVGVKTDVPIYEEYVKTVNITASNISDMFTVANGSYYFAGSGSTFTTNNGGNDSTTATTTLTAKSDMTVSFNYSYSSEQNYDKFTLKVAGTTVENEVSGSTTNKTYNGNLTKGQTIEFTYTKDNSQSKNDDKCTFSNMVVTGTVKTQVGSETKSFARKIKKAYIGIGGVARPCWSGGELAYYGTIAGLSEGKQQGAATSVGNYALFGGGCTSQESKTTTTVDSYDKSLTRNNPTALSKARLQLAATSVGNYALFGGGQLGFYDETNIVDAYNSSLVRTTPTVLTSARFYLAATTVGNYALFGGGRQGSAISTVVDAYDTSLTKTRKDLSGQRHKHAATHVGNYALFGGGTSNTSGTLLSSVEAFNASLTRTTATSLDTATYFLAATHVGNYALFGGGYASSSHSGVNAYDTSLTKTTVENLKTGSQKLAATSVGDYALFGGGCHNDATSYAYVTAYDTSLTRTFTNDLSAKSFALSAANVGDYALFGGGYNSSGHLTTVNAYTVA